MMEKIVYKYGDFDKSQIDYFKNKIRKKIFWLIIYTDEKTNEDYLNVNVEKYQEKIMGQIAGLNSLLSYPKELVFVMSSLEAAMIELKKNDFNFSKYKNYVFDAGAMIEKLCEGD